MNINRVLWVRDFARSELREIRESRGDRPGLPYPNSLYGLCGRKATLDE